MLSIARLVKVKNIGLGMRNWAPITSLVGLRKPTCQLLR